MDHEESQGRSSAHGRNGRLHANRSPKLPHAVVEQIFTYPYSRIGNLVQQGIAGREAVSKYLKELVS